MNFHEIWEVTQNDQILTKVWDVKINIVHMDIINTTFIWNPAMSRENKLFFHDGVILWKERLFMPYCLHHSSLKLAHKVHINTVKCKRIQRSKVRWSHIILELIFYFEMLLVLNHNGSSATGSSDVNFECQDHCGYQWLKIYVILFQLDKLYKF